MKLAKKIIIGTLLVIAVLVIGEFVIPLPETDTLAFRAELAITTAISVLNFGSALLFLVSLKTYKARMRHAFITLSAGILLVAIAIIQLPIVDALRLNDSFWVNSGLEGLPFLFSVLFIYGGIRAFAKLVGTHTLLTNVGATVAAVTILSALVAFLPHAPTSLSESQFDITNAIVVWLGLMGLASTLIVLQIKQRIGAHYVNAMAWLFAALMGSSISIGVTLAIKLVNGDIPDVVTTLSNVATLGLGVLYMQAGYAFTQTEDY